jgi:hypothetical protein
MKRVFISAFVFFIATQFSFSQIPNGFWQEKTQNVSDAYLGGYHFTGKTFEYTINGYDGLNPISALGGEYTIKNGKIFFIVTYIKKVVGGQLCRSETNTLNDSWSIEGGKMSIVKLSPVIKAVAIIEINGSYLIIDKQKFYKVEAN